ncbi:M48 family metalloprotease [Mycolicibacterium fortuitum]|uniref:M48 family metalloprotease n=1 Tax=Mycolicibacterium fortuitum TaxID=1766 RepID=UPI00148F77B6|nr:M56 family metallopeptidase [Mycolicibacterium fortuitum]
MNAAFCLLLYGAVLTWLGPPVLSWLTRSGRSPRLSVTLWVAVIILALGVWLGAGFSVLRELASVHPAGPVRYCLDMLLALNHAGWAGHVALMVIGAVSLAMSAIVMRRLVRTLRQFWMRSCEHAHAARIAGLATGQPEVVVLLANEPAAYCVVGRPHTVVVTSGAVATLDDDELVAVLAHEHAHLSGRHPQLMMLLRALAAAMPRLPLFSAAAQTVGALVEMCADDSAARRHGRDPLLSGLARLAGHSRVADGALGAANTAVVARAARLSTPLGRLSQLGHHVVLAGTLALILATPAAITLLCHS